MARPFRLDGNIATGPGVTDMKAGLLQPTPPGSGLSGAVPSAG